MMWNVIDFEASSLSLTKSYPIQVGLYLADVDLVYKDYIKPIDAWTDWNPASEKIHNIPRPVLFREGSSPLEVATKLNWYLEDSVVYCDGGVYDIWWRDVLFHAAGIKPSFKLLGISDLLWSEEFGFTNAMTIHQYKNDIADGLQLKEHDAGNDAYIIHQCLKQIWLEHNDA